MNLCLCLCKSGLRILIALTYGSLVIKRKIARRDSVTCVSALCHVSRYCSSRAKCSGLGFFNTNVILKTTI